MDKIIEGTFTIDVDEDNTAIITFSNGYDTTQKYMINDIDELLDVFKDYAKDLLEDLK